MRAGWLIVAGLVAGAVWVAREPLGRLLHGEPAGEPAAGGERTGGSGTGTGGDRAAPPAGGDPSYIELRAITPARRYLDAIDEDGADAAYRQAVAGLGRRDVVYDPHLGRAARELAAQRAAGITPPEAALPFFLHSAGAPDANVGQYLVATSDERSEVIAETVREALAGAPGGVGPVLVGIGEAAAEGDPLSRHLAVVLARRGYQLEPVDRQVAAGGTVRLRGHLPAGYSGAHGIALQPDGQLADVEVKSSGSQFTLELPAGKLQGVLEVGIDGVGRDGPGKLLQVAIAVGIDPPRSLNLELPPADPPLAGEPEAEAWATELLQRDRERHGLSRFVADPELAAVARGHARDMRDRGFFGHRSPGTGLLGDRLRTARYPASAHGENLARNDRLGEAEASLMTSVGHRKNILEPAFTHAGVGVVAAGGAGAGADWLVVQVMARRVADIDPAAARARILDQVNRARQQAGARPLETDGGLASAAQRGARQAARAGTLDGLPARVGEEVRGLVSGGAAIGVQALYDLEQFEVPDIALDPEMDRIGVGVDQSTGEGGGRIGVVLVVGR